MNTLVIIAALSVLCCVYAQSYGSFDNDGFGRFSGSGRHFESGRRFGPGRHFDSDSHFRSGHEFDSGRRFGSGRHFESGHRFRSGRFSGGDGLFRGIGDRDYRPRGSSYIPRRSIIRGSY